MTDTKNTEVTPEPAPPVQQAPVVRERRGWVRPLISALVVVAALVVGGIGGFAIATAAHAGGRGAIEQGQFPGGPGQFPQGPPGPQGQDGQQSGPGQAPQNGERPQPPSDQSGDDDGS